MNGLRGKSCKQEVKVPAIRHFAVFHSQAPRKIGEVNPKLLGRLPQPGKEHIEASRCRHHIMFKRECPEQLPRLLDQYVDFGCFHVKFISAQAPPRPSDNQTETVRRVPCESLAPEN